jgi:hypothetical protein
MSKLARVLVLAALLAATLAASGCAARSAATTQAQPTNQPTDQAATSEQSAADPALQRLLARERFATLNGAPLHHSTADPPTTQTTTGGGGLAAQLAAGRLATASYATNLGAAKHAGYQILTRMIPDMGWHYRNPTIHGFDPRKPPILVYQHHGRAWQLAAFEWVFPTKPTTPPLPGATYGSFGAACHYTDGTFVPAPTQDACPKTSPQTGATFNLWHPDLVTLHVWLWYPNPAGLYSGTNPYVQPFNHR